ncbi:MAG TPA: hypothetical protein VLB29_17145 [Nocardioidaceae bacterium]|nr:hypothetical protein [Nocardioidaceae bacterium]
MSLRPRPCSDPRVVGASDARAAVLRALVVLTAAVLLAGCRADAAPSRPPSEPDGAVAPAGFPASDILRTWDGARSRAFAAGDVHALRRLYVDGSAAGTADERLLWAYRVRGLRVEGMRMQLIAVDVLHHDGRRLRVRVTDRLTGAVAVGPRTRLRLPADRASTRVVELRRTGHDEPWRVASVRSSPWRASR